MFNFERNNSLQFIPHIRTYQYTAHNLKDGPYLSSYRPDLKPFLDYFNTETEQDSIAPIALAAVKIIDADAHGFRKQNFSSDHYNTFVKTLKDVIQCGLDSTKKRKEPPHLLVSFAIAYA